MLFADLQGSTAAAELMDPEDWADVVNGAFAHMIAPVERYGGTLARLQGDAILAFFGAPVAHEDDPVRAVRAGLDIVGAFEGYQAQVRARIGAPIAVRVGINTGLVVVGEVGSDQRVEYTALGDAINVAARMEQTADPGTVRVTEYTADLLGGMFALADIGPVEVKGKAEPVRARVVLGPAAAAGAARTTTRLVGRAEERAALGLLLDRLRGGDGGCRRAGW
jgi:class 3 adenylate cyclase